MPFVFHLSGKHIQDFKERYTNYSTIISVLIKMFLEHKIDHEVVRQGMEERQVEIDKENRKNMRRAVEMRWKK
jgi:hypothetical protein